MVSIDFLMFSIGFLLVFSFLDSTASLLQARRSSGYDKLPDSSRSRCLPDFLALKRRRERLNMSCTEPKCFMHHAFQCKGVLFTQEK